MKTKLTILTILAVFLGACSSAYRAGISSYDDLYYAPANERNQAVVAESKVQPEVITQEQPQLQAQAESYEEEELSDYEKYRMELEDQYLYGTDNPEDETFQEADTVYYDKSGTNEYTYYEDQEDQPIVHNHYYYGDVYQDDVSYATRIRRFHSPYLGFSY